MEMEWWTDGLIALGLLFAGWVILVVYYLLDRVDRGVFRLVD